MKKNILVITSAIIVVVLFSAQLIVSNRLATMGATLSDMDGQTQEFTKMNEELSHQIASDSSLLAELVIAPRLSKSSSLTAFPRLLSRI